MLTKNSATVFLLFLPLPLKLSIVLRYRIDKIIKNDHLAELEQYYDVKFSVLL